MAGIVAVLVLITLSVIATRVGSKALAATGVSADLAYFQARSAFTGVGYTTSEAETIVNHPVRRRIILLLMLLGNAGIVSVVASAVLGFSGAGLREQATRFGVLVAGLLALLVVIRSQRFNRWLTRLIERALRRFTDLEIRDYTQLLDVSGDYGVRDLRVEEGDWLAETALADLDLTAEGVLVLGIRRDEGQFLGAPTPDTEILPGDVVVLYGREDSLRQLDERKRGRGGDAEHERATREQQRVQAGEQARDVQARAERGR